MCNNETKLLHANLPKKLSSTVAKPMVDLDWPSVNRSSQRRLVAATAVEATVASWLAAQKDGQRRRPPDLGLRVRVTSTFKHKVINP